MNTVDLRPIKIGDIAIETPLFLAPMAGVSDFPLREIARQQGAGVCISEMVTSKTELWHTDKSQFRLPSEKDPEPRPVQIAGAEPQAMAEAARRCADLGAGIIDINMGCPAKKVCARAAGSALLADEELVAEILSAVVDAVDVPVTLKTRTGTSPEHKNIVRVAQLAESIGVRAITVHGRTRACRFNGTAEYDSIADVVNSVNIPVIANGDITTPEKAAEVLKTTGAAGLMIGRGAWGKPWLFRQIREHLNGQPIYDPDSENVYQVCTYHLHMLYEQYGPEQGTKFARKHVDRYLQELDSDRSFRKHFNLISSADEQLKSLQHYFHTLTESAPKAA